MVIPARADKEDKANLTLEIQPIGLAWNKVCNHMQIFFTFDYPNDFFNKRRRNILNVHSKILNAMRLTVSIERDAVGIILVINTE